MLTSRHINCLGHRNRIKGSSGWACPSRRAFLSMSARTCGRSAALACALIAALAGCADNRISIEEFVAMQQEMPPRLAAVEIGVFDVDGEPAATAPGLEHMTEEAVESRPAPVTVRAPYRLGPGDVLTVGLTGLNETVDVTPVQVRLNRNGEVVLPVAGMIKIGGMEIEDAEDAILDAYVPKYFRTLSVNIEVLQYEPTTVVVSGAALQPGLVSLRRSDRTLMHAVAAAGGLNPTASGRVRLKRLANEGQEITLNLLDPVELRAALSLEPLESGDIVTIEAAQPSAIYVGGLVNVPGQMAVPPGASLNLLQCLTAAGGLRTEVFPKEGTLIRRMPSGQDVHVKIDLDRLRNDPTYPNVQLAAGDVLVVPDTVGTMAMDWVNKNVFFRFGGTASYNVIGTATGVEYLNRREQQSSQNGGGSTLENSIDPIGFLSAPAALAP